MKFYSKPVLQLVFLCGLLTGCDFVPKHALLDRPAKEAVRNPSNLPPTEMAWQPSAGHHQIELWPNEVPDIQQAPGPEYMDVSKSLIAGKTVIGVHNVTRPTMTIYRPEKKMSDGTVVVIPGGGFEILAMDLEGTEICDWITSRGLTCVLLKYRVPSLPYDWHTKSRPHNLQIPPALEDVQRTIGLLRFNAEKWNLNPHKIGVIGFSAGGYLVASISTNYEQRLYRAVDEADKESCRPDFAIGIYPGHLWQQDKTYKLNPNVPVTSKTPPTFLLQAQDDDVDGIKQSLVYYMALKDAGVPTEMHLYANGKHAFGLRPRSDLPITNWPNLVDTWLKTIGVTAKPESTEH